MKTWNTCAYSVRTVGLATAGLVLSAASVAAAEDRIFSGPYTGPSSIGFPTDNLLIDDFEGDRPVGLSFEPSSPNIVPGNSVQPDGHSLMLGSWAPFEVAAMHAMFDAAALGGAPTQAGFVVTESAGLGMPAPITITVYLADGSTVSQVVDVLSDGASGTDDVFVGVENAVGISRITVASIIPISVDNVMYTSVAALPVAYVKDDVNGDGISDTTWYRSRRSSTETNTATVWLWNSGSSFTNLAPSLAAPSRRAKMLGVGDADADKKADLLWFEASTGRAWVWLMGGVAVNSVAVDRTLTGGWTVVGYDDLNGDKKADIVFRRTRGATTEMRVWEMDGAVVTNEVVANIAGGFNQVFTGDLDRDGRADLLMRSVRAAGCATETYFTSSLVDGALTAPARLENADGTDEMPLDRRYSVAGIADMTGDGAADIVWRHTSGDILIWDIDAMKVSSKSVLSKRATGLRTVGFPDVNGDGVREMAFRTARGDTSVWSLTGSTVSDTAAARISAPWVPAVNGK